MAQAQEMFEVEEITGKERRQENGGRLCYKVKWVGYDEITWEPIENLKHLREAIKYEKAHPEGDGKPQKRQRSKALEAPKVEDGVVPVKRKRGTRLSAPPPQSAPVRAEETRTAPSKRRVTIAEPAETREEATAPTQCKAGANEKVKQVRRACSSASQLPPKKEVAPRPSMSAVGDRAAPKPTGSAHNALDKKKENTVVPTQSQAGTEWKSALNPETLYADIVFAAGTAESVNNAELPREGKAYRLQKEQASGVYGVDCYEKGKLAAFVQFGDGLFEYVPLELAEEKCPKLLLIYYRLHISTGHEEEGGGRSE